MALRTTELRSARHAPIDRPSGLAAPWQDALPVCRDAIVDLARSPAGRCPVTAGSPGYRRRLALHLAAAADHRGIRAIHPLEPARSAKPGAPPASRSCPPARRRAMGLFQLRSLDASFANAEWGFALGSAYWGTGSVRGRRDRRSRLRLRHDRRAPPRGAGGRGQRPWQRRAPEDGRRAGGCAAPVVLQARPALRSGAVVDVVRGLASPAEPAADAHPLAGRAKDFPLFPGGYTRARARRGFRFRPAA